MRNFFHIVISICLWCLFGYYWYVVGQRQVNTASLQALGILALITLLGVLATVWWIAHNKNLASRNRRRQAPPTAPETFATDHLGRELSGPGLDVLKQAGTIVIKLDDEGHKVYAVVEGVVD